MGKPVIAFIGAGSTVFTRALLKDIYTFPELQDAEIRLVDIDPQRLADSEQVAINLRAATRADGPISATLDRESALAAADYVICTVQIGGYDPATIVDFEIPKRYGLRQTIGDTLGIGGIMRGLRSIPVLAEIALDMERLCPDALLLNYTNPMATLIWGVSQLSGIQTVGLCHSVQHTAAEIAHALQIPVEEIDYAVAGINHMAFYLRLERNGKDLYPDLTALQESGEYPAWERVRFTFLRDWGYFVTESSEHFSEYLPWFIKANRDDLIERYNIPLDEYPTRCQQQIAEWAEMREALVSGEPGAFDAYRDARATKLSGISERRLAMQERENPELAARLREQLLDDRKSKETGHSGEYGSLIIHSMETGIPRVIYGNVINNGSISNLPVDCCVEVPCLVDHNGIQQTVVGELPPQLASLNQTNINVQRMTVEGAITGDRMAVYQAAMLDPHTAAQLDPDQIRSMVDELLLAHKEWLPQFA